MYICNAPTDSTLWRTHGGADRTISTNGGLLRQSVKIQVRSVVNGTPGSWTLLATTLNIVHVSRDKKVEDTQNQEIVE